MPTFNKENADFGLRNLDFSVLGTMGYLYLGFKWLYLTKEITKEMLILDSEIFDFSVWGIMGYS